MKLAEALVSSHFMLSLVIRQKVIRPAVAQDVRQRPMEIVNKIESEVLRCLEQLQARADLTVEVGAPPNGARRTAPPLPGRLAFLPLDLTTCPGLPRMESDYRETGEGQREGEVFNVSFSKNLTNYGATLLLARPTCAASYTSARCWKVMETVHGLLGRGEHLSKRCAHSFVSPFIDLATLLRDLYYSNVNLMKSQATSDRWIKKVSSAFGLKGENLNVVRPGPITPFHRLFFLERLQLGASKGLISGLLSFWSAGNKTIANAQEPTIVPGMLDQVGIFETDAEFLLIIEKECTFRKRALPSFLPLPMSPDMLLPVIEDGFVARANCLIVTVRSLLLARNLLILRRRKDFLTIPLGASSGCWSRRLGSAFSLCATFDSSWGRPHVPSQG